MLPKAYQLLFDRDVKTDSHAIALSKILVNAFVVRGAQLSIINRLDGEHFVSLHTRLVGWAAKKVAAYEANKKKSLRNKALHVFRALSNLLLGVQPAEASRMCVSFRIVFTLIALMFELSWQQKESGRGVF
jgi:cohesin complex subunit SA-1/2